MKTPTIKWAQNHTFIFVDIELVPNDYEINIKENEICFKQGEYECNLDLFAKIIVDKSKYIKNRIFEFVLKKEEDKEWKQLLENKNQYKISVNWDKYDISDDEEDTHDNGMPDMSSLMGGQGGMPDMSSLMGGQEGMPDMSSLMGGQDGMPDMSSLMGGMPGDFASMGKCCKDEDCEGCYEDDFEVNSDEEELDKEELDKEGLDEEELDKEELDKEELDKEELDKEELDKEELDKEELDKLDEQEEKI